MNPRDDVIISYGDTPDGVTHSGQQCPSCRGGHKAERSFSVGRTGAFLWWMCHRASCGFTGKEALSGTGGEYPTSTDERRGRYRNFVRNGIPRNISNVLCERFSITPDDMVQARWAFTPDYDGHGQRVVMPILSPDGRVRGENFRSYWGDEPKSLINAELAENVICWYRFRKYSRVCVIVEDQPSALRVAASGQSDAVALLGTTLNLERILEIREQEYARVWLSLDRDAYAKAVKYMQEFKNYLPALRIKPIDVDIKDMPADMFDLYITEVIQT